jgi:hypothetical protein
MVSNAYSKPETDVPALITLDDYYYIVPVHEEAANDYEPGLSYRRDVTSSGAVNLAFVISGRTDPIEWRLGVILQITPKSIESAAYFRTIAVGDPGPAFDRAYYNGTTTEENGEKSGFVLDGLIEDDLRFFDKKKVALYTPYKQGDPAGTYDIYARSGYYDVYGNLVGEIADGYVDGGNYVIDGSKFIMVGDEKYVWAGSFRVIAEGGTPSLSPSSPVIPPPAEEETEGLFTDDHIKYIYGYPDGLIKPERALTRAEASAVFFRLLSEGYRAGVIKHTNSFADVESGSWYNTEVSTLVGIGILEGYPDGSFRPNERITRAELASISVRFAEIMGETGEVEADFTDIAGHWAEDAIVRAAEIGWVAGYPDRSFRPGEPIIRAEFVTIVNRMLARAPETADDLLPGAMKQWPDNTPDKWYYLDMQEATNAHAYERKDTQVPGRKYNYEKWTRILEAPDAAPNEP